MILLLSLDVKCVQFHIQLKHIISMIYTVSIIYLIFFQKCSSLLGIKKARIKVYWLYFKHMYVIRNAESKITTS